MCKLWDNSYHVVTYNIHKFHNRMYALLFLENEQGIIFFFFLFFRVPYTVFLIRIVFLF
jgi:hypothetical protein